MNKKHLVITLTLFMGLQNSFALELHQAQLISYHEWTTGNGIGSFKSNPTKINIPTLKIPADITESYHYTKVQNFVSSGVVGLPINVNGDIYIFIQNFTNTTQLYRYDFKVCAKPPAPLWPICTSSSSTYQLEPNGWIDDDILPILQVTFNYPGTYESTIEADFYEANQGAYYSVSSDITSGIIQVSH